jgi:hypothetical protein
MATIKELLSAMIDKINGNEDKIDNIKGVPEAFDSITMTNGTDVANLTMSADKELLLDGEAINGVASWTDLENKPFYSEVKEIEILPLTQAREYIQPWGSVGPETVRFIISNAIDGVNVGETYTVTYNGVNYECVGQAFEDTIIVRLGNFSDFGGNGNGEPFAMEIVPVSDVENLGYGAMIMSLEGATSVTVGIKQIKEVVTQISGKYVEGMGYAEKTLVDIIPECTLTRSDTSPFFVTPDMVANLILTGFVVGEEYTVTCNGTEYKTKAQIIEGMGVTAIGNIGGFTGGINTGEPFVIANYSGQYYIVFYLDDTVTTLDLKVTGNIVDFYKINENYLPQADFHKNGCVNYYSVFDVVKGGYLTLEIGSTIYGDIEEALEKHALPPEVNYNNNTYCCTSASHYGSSDFGDNFHGTFTAHAIDTKTKNVCRIDASFSDYEYDSVLESVKITYPNSTILQSSTSGSTKQFQITVDDNGTISATEVTER